VDEGKSYQEKQSLDVEVQGLAEKYNATAFTDISSYRIDDRLFHYRAEKLRLKGFSRLENLKSSGQHEPAFTCRESSRMFLAREGLQQAATMLQMLKFFQLTLFGGGHA
jgi:hypothetical protein